MKKSILAFVVVLVIITGVFTGCSKESNGNGAAASKLGGKEAIVVGLDDTFVPMGFKDEKGELTGFDVELAREVFKRLGLNVKFQAIDWAMKETELNSGNIDLIWNGYTITNERMEKVAFTKPYMENRQVIITLSNSNIGKKSELNGKRVGIQNGSSSLDAVNKEPELVKSFKNGEPVLFDTNNEALMDLEAGRIDAVVADEILARYYIKARGAEKYRVLDEDFGREEYGIGVRKDDKVLLDKVNKTLSEMKDDGTSQRLSEKWFGKNIIK